MPGTAVPLDLPFLNIVVKISWEFLALKARSVSKLRSELEALGDANLFVGAFLRPLNKMLESSPESGDDFSLNSFAELGNASPSALRKSS